MNSTTHPRLTASLRASAASDASPAAFRQPAYECEEHRDDMTLVVYVPGVTAAEVDIEGRGADLTITARKPRFVRVNFNSLHLEGAQLDYRLRLRLGHGLDFAAMQAVIADGVLTVTLPKRSSARPLLRMPRAA